MQLPVLPLSILISSAFGVFLETLPSPVAHRNDSGDHQLLTRVLQSNSNHGNGGGDPS
jgi:hypothetical protein